MPAYPTNACGSSSENTKAPRNSHGLTEIFHRPWESRRPLCETAPHLPREMAVPSPPDRTTRRSVPLQHREESVSEGFRSIATTCAEGRAQLLTDNNSYPFQLVRDTPRPFSPIDATGSDLLPTAPAPDEFPPKRTKPLTTCVPQLEYRF